MVKKKIFIAIDTNKVSKAKKIIKIRKQKKLSLVTSFGFNFFIQIMVENLFQV